MQRTSQNSLVVLLDYFELPNKPVILSVLPYNSPKVNMHQC